MNVDYSKTWYSSELRELRLQKNAAGLVAEAENSESSWANYRRIRNKYNRKIRNSANAEIKAKIQNFKDDPKRLWKEVKRFTTNNNNTQKTVQHLGITYTDPETIANIFNEYFIKSVTEIKNSIHDVVYTDNLDQERVISAMYDFDELNYVKLGSLIRKIRTKSGI